MDGGTSNVLDIVTSHFIIVRNSDKIIIEDIISIALCWLI